MALFISSIGYLVQGAACQQAEMCGAAFVVAVGLTTVGEVPARALIGMASVPVAPVALACPPAAARLPPPPAPEATEKLGVPAMLVVVNTSGVAEVVTAPVEFRAAVRKSM